MVRRVEALDRLERERLDHRPAEADVGEVAPPTDANHEAEVVAKSAIAGLDPSGA